MRSAGPLGSVMLVGVLLSACTGGSADEGGSQARGDAAAEEGGERNGGVEVGADVEDIAVSEIIDVVDRDPSFTQGLELLEDGTMVHSRGLYGESAIEVLSPAGEVLRSEDLPEDEFGEGVTVVPNPAWDEDWPNVGPLQLAYQLTWKSGVVHTWSVPDLVEGPSLEIDGEGWGLCYDESREALWQSDGSSTLRLLAVEDLAPLAEISVTEDAGGERVEVDDLNELECVEGQVWANVWKSDDIVLVDPSVEKESGRVSARLDLTTLVEAENPAAEEDVLNGIALDPRDDTLLVTGKNWEHLYRFDRSASDDG